MFRKLFNQKNPKELTQTLAETTDEKCNELLKDLNIKLTVLKDQINTDTGVSCTRLENLVNAVEDILDSVRWRDNNLIQKVENLLHREEINQDKD